MRAWLSVVAVLACLAPHAVVAQVELVLDAGVGAPAVGDFADDPPGPSFGVALHVSRWADAQAGLELVYARHGGIGLEGPATQFGVLALARYELSPGPFGFYVGGKMGAIHRSLTVVDEPATTDGFVLGPSAALRFQLGTMRMQLTLDALYQTFEELMMYGQREYGTDEDGLRFVFRAGLVFPLESLIVGGDSP